MTLSHNKSGAEFCQGTISGGGASGAGGALPPSIMGKGMVLPFLLVLSLPSGAGVVLVIVMLGSFVIGSPFIVHQKIIQRERHFVAHVGVGEGNVSAPL